MLGSMVTDVLGRDANLTVIGAVRSKSYAATAAKQAPHVTWCQFEITDETQTIAQLQALGPANWIINAIGLTKPYIHDDNPAEIERAIVGNAQFPHWLAHAAATFNGKVLQIATDCVYSGADGRYTETAKHDALDVYGKTKSLGEALLDNIHHLRCSIIGPEPKAHTFLIEWFRRQPENAMLNGFINHCWNGVTTYHFAKLCHGIIRFNLPLNHLQHIIPSGAVTKYEMLEEFAKAFNRQDIVINPLEAGAQIDRTLATENKTLNLEMWRLAGYIDRPPTVPEMISELAAFDYRFKNMAL